MPDKSSESSSAPDVPAYAYSLAVVPMIFVGWLVWLFFQFAASHPRTAVIMLIVAAIVYAVQYATSGRGRGARVAELRQRQAEVYEPFLLLWLDIASGKGSGKDTVLKAEYRERLAELHPQILLQASDRVIQEYLRFRSAVNLSEKVSPLETLPLLEKLVIAMREDLGHHRNAMRCGDLLRQFAEDGSPH